MISFLTMFLEKTYQLFLSIRVPGFNVSILSVFLGSIAAIVSISLLKMFFGLGNSAVSGGLGTIRGFFGREQKGGNNKNIKISEKRKGDTK